MRLVFTALTLSLAAIAAPATATTFNDDGTRYEYSRVDQADGVILINGRAIDDGTSFSLRIIASRVTGTVAEQPVDFRISKKAMAEIAANPCNAIAAK